MGTAPCLAQSSTICIIIVNHHQTNGKISTGGSPIPHVCVYLFPNGSSIKQQEDEPQTNISKTISLF